MFSTLLALALVAQPDTDQEEKQDENAKSEQVVEEKAEDKRVCRRISTGMGSRRKERVCMTRDEWREFNRGN